MALPENLQINGKDYAVSSLSDAASEASKGRV